MFDYHAHRWIKHGGLSNQICLLNKGITLSLALSVFNFMYHVVASAIKLYKKLPHISVYLLTWLKMGISLNFSCLLSKAA